MTRTPEEVFAHHAQALGAGDLDKIVADYADDAVFITSSGIMRGKEGVRAAFTQLLSDLPNASWALKTQIFDGDLLFLEWAAESEATQADDGVDDAGVHPQAAGRDVDRVDAERAAAEVDAEIAHLQHHALSRAARRSPRMEQAAVVSMPTVPDDLITLLEHLVLSHHGERELGAPVDPSFAEALAFHFLDNLDAKLASI